MKVNGYSILAVFGGLLASSCCTIPLILGIFSLGGFGLGTVLAPYRPLFIVVTAIFLGLAFYMTYFRKRITECEDGECRTTPVSKLSRRFLWIIAVIVIGLTFSPEIIGAFTKTTLSAPAKNSEIKEVLYLQINGMTCKGCATHIKSKLDSIEGVYGSEVDYEKGSAKVYTNVSLEDSVFEEAIKGAGYNGTVSKRESAF